MSEIVMGDCRLYEVRLVLSVSTYKINPSEADYDEALEFVLDTISTNSDCYVLGREQRRLVVTPEVTA